MSLKRSEAIALLDCDSFFVSCEQLFNPKLKNKPVCVMSNNDGCVIARSKEAKALGIEMGMPIFKAKKLYPQAHYLSGRIDLYGHISQRIMITLQDFSPTVEIYSIDEAFIDLTGLKRLYKKSYLEIAQEIQKNVHKNIGIPVSVGVSLSKTLAKLATNKAKKNKGYYLINSRNLNKELYSTKLIDIWGMGPNTVALLNKYGIKTAYDFLLQNDLWIKKILGKKGIEIKYELMGKCISPVSNKIALPKSIQRTSSFASCTSDHNYIKASLHYHSHRACKTLRKLNLKTQLVGVMLRSKDFKIFSANNILVKPSDWEFEIFNIANKLFEDLFSNQIIYRSSGIFFSNFTPSSELQLSLFESPECQIKKTHLINTWEQLEDKYGQNIITTAGAKITPTTKHYFPNLT